MDEVMITLDRASAIPVLGVLVNEQMDALLLAATASGEERERELARARILRGGVEAIASALYEALRQAMVELDDRAGVRGMSVAASFFSGGRIALSPWSAQSMDPDTLAALEARATALDVYVSTIKRKRGEWMIRTGHDNFHVVSKVMRGTLSDCIDWALDAYEGAFTADELLTIQEQSA